MSPRERYKPDHVVCDAILDALPPYGSRIGDHILTVSYRGLVARLPQFTEKQILSAVRHLVSTGRMVAFPGKLHFREYQRAKEKCEDQD